MRMQHACKHAHAHEACALRPHTVRAAFAARYGGSGRGRDGLHLLWASYGLPLTARYDGSGYG